MIRFTCDSSAAGTASVGNRFDNLSFWHFLGTTPDERMWHEWAEAMPDGWLKQRYPWLEEMQIFVASGGAYVGYPRQEGDVAPCEFNRDLFKNPADRTVLDDYDFTPLVRACRNMLRQGVRPCLKLHGVPLKFSSRPKIDWFRVNCRPPDNYPVYADYISALVRAMVDAFGLGEVSAWRWFIGTEMENKNWWEAQDESPETTKLEFLKLYDWSVFAIERVLGVGSGRAIGAHAMMTNGIWKPEDFFEHCHSGKNCVTGNAGSRLDFFAISYYDRAPGYLESDEWQTTNLTGAGGDLANFDKIIERTRRALDDHGFGSLLIEVSEGAMLFGMDGKWLWHGLCPGGVFDASWTAWAFWKMLESGTVRWSRWPLLRTDGLFHGPEAVATHAMRMISEMKDDLRLPVVQADDGRLIRVIAGISPAKDRVRLLVFHHAADVTKPAETASIHLHVTNLPFAGTVRIRRRVLDAKHGDFWSQWEKDRAAAGIIDKDYFRSRDQFDVAHALSNPAHVALWKHKEPEYEALAALPVPITEIHRTAGGTIDLHDERPCFSLALFEIEPAGSRPRFHARE